MIENVGSESTKRNEKGIRPSEALVTPGEVRGRSWVGEVDGGDGPSRRPLVRLRQGGVGRQRGQAIVGAVEMGA